MVKLLIQLHAIIPGHEFVGFVIDMRSGAKEKYGVTIWD